MTRRKSITSAAGQVELHKQIAEGVKVPAHIKLRPADKPYWKSITDARKDWNEHDLIQAAALARCYSDIKKLQTQLDKEGMVVESSMGNLRPNPLVSLIDMLTKRSLSIARSIQVHAQATQGESKVQVKRNQAKAEALRQMEAAQRQRSTEEDDLLARPAH